ncbi:hypothetical protein BS50DRAFT_635861 [Corynespora cassiicola Philippines]|uniref:UbiA prenyltransferase n=1 Tax=Corynespora cassiicola Philippines TaxID=1448308 RepID=A0A2T2NIE1_CORCC|nr:hypothetical protein BS50DRAFT_635861 [Corynespora cassiicola Philippines]
MPSFQSIRTLHGRPNIPPKTIKLNSTKQSTPDALLWELMTNFWLLTKDDAATFVVPNTIFGLCGALAGSTLIVHSSTFLDVFLRLPLVIVFNWSNLLIFDLANQRLPESAQEDALNKPWRPVPSGRLTSNQVRLAMLFFIPTVFALNHFLLQVGNECALILILTWLYNDLRGGDEDWILRNGIIAAAFALYNTGSIKIAAGIGFSQHSALTRVGWEWVVVISGVIFTTMHVQDLKDQEGDRARSRRSAPFVLGDLVARQSISLPVIFWSCFCPWFWGCRLIGMVPVMIGAFVAWRCINLKGKKADRRTWELWALWTAVLYSSPLW